MNTISSFRIQQSPAECMHFNVQSRYSKQAFFQRVWFWSTVFICFFEWFLFCNNETIIVNDFIFFTLHKTCVVSNHMILESYDTRVHEVSLRIICNKWLKKCKMMVEYNILNYLEFIWKVAVDCLPRYFFSPSTITRLYRKCFPIIS